MFHLHTKGISPHMDKHEPTNVLTAFEMLLEEVENEVEFVNRAGARAFGQGDYDEVDAMRSLAQRLTDFRTRAADLRREWLALAAEFEPTVDEDAAAQAERRNLGRLKRGMRTPEEAYRLPILHALVEMGGAGQTADVLAVVERDIKGQLQAVDYEQVPSNPNMQRWYYTAQWARNALVKEGLMQSDSPRGMWEISEEGRAVLDNAAAGAAG